VCGIIQIKIIESGDFAIQCMVLYHNVITEMVFYNNEK
jgi:hypothetical protein